MASTASVELTVPGIKGIASILGDDTRLLEHQCKTISKDSLLLPGPDYVDRAYGLSDRSPRVLGALQSVLDTGRLARHGLRLHSPGRPGHRALGRRLVRARIPLYFDPENIVKLAVEGGCNAVASTLGVLGSVSRKYAHKIPFIVKFNHNEFISYPNAYDQIRFASVRQAFDMGAVAVGATIYFGSEESKRQIQEVTDDVPAGARAGAVHRALVLPAQSRRSRPRKWTITWPPISPGRPITSASRSRPTSSSRRCPRTTAATTRSTSGRRTRRSIRSCRATIRSI